MNWAEPGSFKEWIRRIFVLRIILLILIASAILISELRFDWIEQSLGAYLMTTNSRRPESGAIWEIDRRTITARQSLEQIITDRQSSQREARDAATFVQIASYLSLNQGVMLSPDHFRKLYLGLPPTIAQEIASPFEILEIFSEDRLARTYFEKKQKGLRIYFLDADNRVLRQLAIAPYLLDHIGHGDRMVVGALEDFSKFENRIYAGQHFFNTLASLPEDIRRGVVPQPESLLKISAHILRVGISDEVVSGFIELGFEIAAETQKKVVLLPGREWAVWQIRSALEGKKSEMNVFSDHQR